MHIVVSLRLPPPPSPLPQGAGVLFRTLKMSNSRSPLIRGDLEGFGVWRKRRYCLSVLDLLESAIQCRPGNIETFGGLVNVATH